MSKARRFARLTRFAPYVVGEGLRDLCTCACTCKAERHDECSVATLYTWTPPSETYVCRHETVSSSVAESVAERRAKLRIYRSPTCPLSSGPRKPSLRSFPASQTVC